MRILRTVIPLALLPAALLAQNEPLRGIEAGDIDRSANACVDFFQFGNGKWRAENPIPPSLGRWSRRWAAGESSKDKLREILEQTSADTGHPKGSTEQLVGDFYGSCMDEAQANRAGAAPLAPMLARIDRVRDAAGVKAVIAELQSRGINAPFALFGASDNHDPEKVIAHVFASGLRMPDRDYYLKPEPRFRDARARYAQHVEKMFALAGYPAARAKAAAAAVVRVETSLARASLDNVALRDPRATDHAMSFAALQKLTPRFDWGAYYRKAEIPRGRLNVAEPRFLREFDRQLGATPVADWKTYLTWHYLDDAAGSLSDAFVQEEFAFHDAFLNGAKEPRPRWNRCVEATDALLGEALGREYVERHFPPEAKARMQEMVANLRTAMGETIEGLDWMSAATKRRALEKLSTFNPKLGYPDKWKDYGSVAISRDSFVDNVVAATRFARGDNLSQIGKPVDRERWLMTPPTSNAYYNAPLNEIVFPAGILQPPAFSMAANDAVNYGAIGVVIGHEISHGFDDQGAKYDARGRLRNWWTAADLGKFRMKTECVVRQFDSYFVEPGLHHNGRLVLGESIGDLAGVKIAYRAFKLAQRGKPPIPTLDGFTPEQQFFIAWAQFRGDEVRPEMARSMVQGDPHPIGKYRVIGPLSNLPEFQQAFSCPLDSPMVRPPSERCDVW